MPIAGIGNSAVSSQQSLFNSSGESQANSNVAKSSTEKSQGNVKQQMKVSTLKNSLEQKEQMATQLINSTQGIGQNIDIKA